MDGEMDSRYLTELWYLRTIEAGRVELPEKSGLVNGSPDSPLRGPAYLWLDSYG